MIDGVYIEERELASSQARVKEAKKVTVREPTPTPTIITHSRLAQTDPWTPPSPVVERDDEPNKEFQTMMQAKVEALENKYQTIIEQKNSQIQQLMQEVKKMHLKRIENQYCFIGKSI